jgi:RNA-directed DNA polymerase
MGCDVRDVESRLRKKPATTEDATPVSLPRAFVVNGKRLPVNLFTLRQKLYEKAKREPTFRFYSLYGLIARLDVLEAAWALVADNGGAPGVDGVTIRQIETSPGGVGLLVAALHRELQTKRYKPQAVRRVFILKANGKRRPLGIPTVRDRVVQAAARLILEPIFEADFLDASYGYRPGRNAHEALVAIARNVQDGYTEIYDADLQAYFDTIPHDKLLKCVERRVADGAVLRLLHQWLVAPVDDRDERGRPKRSRPTQGIGTPQGGVISPLLANVYLHWMDVTFHRRSGPGTWAKARLVRYADDFVIMAKYIGHQIPAWVEATTEGWLGLTINREKTQIVRLTPTRGESLTFLSYTFRYDWDRSGRGTRYFTAVPSAQALTRTKNELRALISSRQNFVPIPQLIERVNRKLKGWQNYFSFGRPRGTYRVMNAFVIERLMHHLQRRSQRAYRPPAGMSWYGLITGPLGLKLLTMRATPR